MKLSISKYVYEPPALAIEPETDYEAAVLQRYWPKGVELSVGKGSNSSANGFGYTIKFVEPPGGGEGK